MSGAKMAQGNPAEMRWLNVQEAASYVGVSVETFLDEVARGVWPPAGRTPDAEPLWDKKALDAASDQLSGFDERSQAAPAEATPRLLDIHQAARMLRCSPDTIRRVPADELPVYRPGKRNLYRLEDVLTYATTRSPRDAGVSQEQIDAALMRVRSNA